MASLEVDNLTDSELRSKLAECGHPVGPVTETTRKILIKKLKILMKQKNSVKNTNRSLSRFSSGDDSGSDTDQNGSSRNSKRLSMPPPSSYKSSKRRTSTRNSTPEVSPVPSSSKISSSTPIGPTRSNTDVRNRFSAPPSLKQTYFPSRIRSPIGTPSFTYEFESGSDSDVTDLNRSTTSSTKRSRIGPTYGTLSSYRSRLNSSNSSTGSKNSTDLNVSRSKSYNSKKEPRQNLMSGFVQRLSRMNDALNPQDIKESDGEEDEPSDKWISVNVAARNSNNNHRDWGLPFKTFYQNLKSKETPVTSSKWKSWNSSQLLSMLLLALFIIFFIWLGLAYFKVTQRSTLTGKSNNFYPFCTDDDDKLARVNCIKKEELPYAVQLYKEVHLELQARALRSMCGPVLQDGSLQKPSMTERELVQFLARSTETPDLWKVEQGIENLKLLLLSNRHWGITLVKESDDYKPNAECSIPDDRLALPSDFNADTNILFISPCPRVPWTCYLARLFYKVLFIVAMLSLGVSAAYLAVVSFRYYRKTKQEEHEKVMAMVGRILEFVSETSDKANTSADANGSASVGPQDYVAVRHVHDTLIHPTERQTMATVWSKAVKFIEENESRIRTEIQQVWGEDATVWRWLGPPLNRTQSTPPEGNNESNHLYPDLSSLKAEAKKGSDRVWQGEAFETSEGSMNSLPFSPTQCLKIRHMFKPDKDYGPDWVLKVQDAIVEKCEGAKIIHLSVDQPSKDGCVYVKCASQHDAGLAYRHLHGSWFDGALVTVKYLRLERYHERFPDSVNAKSPLRPSNNLKLSLQGTSSA